MNLKTTRHGKAGSRRHRSRGQSGQVMAEACIGLTLLTFVWILFSFTCYMANNRTRTLMAARHVAWLQGNNQQPPNATIGQEFGFDNPQLVTLQPPQGIHLTIANAGSSRVDFADKDGNNDAWLVTVSYGMSAGAAQTTAIFPFSAMRGQLPFISSDLAVNFTSVSSQCAWPANVGDTWQDQGKAIKEVVQLILNEAGGLIKFLGNLF